MVESPQENVGDPISEIFFDELAAFREERAASEKTILRARQIAETLPKKTAATIYLNAWLTMLDACMDSVLACEGESVLQRAREIAERRENDTQNETKLKERTYLPALDEKTQLSARAQGWNKKTLRLCALLAPILDQIESTPTSFKPDGYWPELNTEEEIEGSFTLKLNGEKTVAMITPSDTKKPHELHKDYTDYKSIAGNDEGNTTPKLCGFLQAELDSSWDSKVTFKTQDGQKDAGAKHLSGVHFGLKPVPVETISDEKFSKLAPQEEGEEKGCIHTRKAIESQIQCWLEKCLVKPKIQGLTAEMTSHHALSTKVISESRIAKELSYEKSSENPAKAKKADVPLEVNNAKHKRWTTYPIRSAGSLPKDTSQDHSIKVWPKLKGKIPLLELTHESGFYFDTGLVPVSTKMKTRRETPIYQTIKRDRAREALSKPLLRKDYDEIIRFIAMFIGTHSIIDWTELQWHDLLMSSIMHPLATWSESGATKDCFIYTLLDTHSPSYIGKIEDDLSTLKSAIEAVKKYHPNWKGDDIMNCSLFAETGMDLRSNAAPTAEPTSTALKIAPNEAAKLSKLSANVESYRKIAAFVMDLNFTEKRTDPPFKQVIEMMLKHPLATYAASGETSDTFAYILLDKMSMTSENTEEGFYKWLRIIEFYHPEWEANSNLFWQLSNRGYLAVSWIGNYYPGFDPNNVPTELSDRIAGEKAIRAGMSQLDSRPSIRDIERCVTFLTQEPITERQQEIANNAKLFPPPAVMPGGQRPQKQPSDIIGQQMRHNAQNLGDLNIGAESKKWHANAIDNGRSVTAICVAIAAAALIAFATTYFVTKGNSADSSVADDAKIPANPNDSSPEPITASTPQTNSIATVSTTTEPKREIEISANTENRPTSRTHSQTPKNHPKEVKRERMPTTILSVEAKSPQEVEDPNEKARRAARAKKPSRKHQQKR